jgi:hypothetical protein
MLDLINCKELSDTTRVHSTVLDEASRSAVTRAPDHFRAGEQVFENYGQPNSIYFQYHGFVLDSNTHDCVTVPVPIEREDPGARDLSALRQKLRQLGFNRSTCTDLLRAVDQPRVWQARKLSAYRSGRITGQTLAWQRGWPSSRVAESPGSRPYADNPPVVAGRARSSGRTSPTSSANSSRLGCFATARSPGAAPQRRPSGCSRARKHCWPPCYLTIMARSPRAHK